MNFVRGGPGFGGYAAVFVADDRVKTWYDAGQLQLTRPFTGENRWGGGLAYTFSKSTEQGQSQDLFWGFDDRYPTVGDRPRRVTPGDQRHAIVANTIVELPYEFLFSTIVNLGSGIAQNATDATLGFGPYQQRTYIFTPPTRAFLGIGNVFATQNMDLRLQKNIQLCVVSDRSSGRGPVQRIQQQEFWLLQHNDRSAEPSSQRFEQRPRQAELRGPWTSSPGWASLRIPSKRRSAVVVLGSRSS